MLRLIIALCLVFASCTAKAQEVFVSFTFDDAPKSVAKIALPILDRNDFPATLYISTKNTEYPGYMNWDDIAFAADHGWEVAAHTHMHGDLTQMTDSEILDDLLTSAQVFAQHGYSPEHFATPFGAFDDRVMDIIQRHFISHRTAWPDGINAREVDPYNIISYAIESHTTIEEVKKALSDLINQGDWLVFQFHHITPQGGVVSGPYDTDLLAQIVQLVQAEDKISVLTVGDALKQFEKGKF